MHKTLLENLIDTKSGEHFKLHNEMSDHSGDIISGKLKSSTKTIEIIDGIPVFLDDEELAKQEQTDTSFSFKWETADQFYTQLRSSVEDDTFKFMEETEPIRYGFKNIGEMRDHYAQAGDILEVGCGSGHYTPLYLTDNIKGTWTGADLSRGIIIAKKRLGGIPNTNFVRCNLFNLPFAEEKFDLVHCRGVMHHTPDTKLAFQSVCRHVKKGGELVFLIYRKNNPIREFTDDFLRESTMNMNPDEAWDHYMQLTELGKALANVDQEIDLPVDVELLGIPKGKYNVHMLIYNYFLKAFWKPDWTMEESNIITFDWYHPQYVFRHTKEEIYSWCEENNFEITSFDDRWVGFTVRARRL